VSALREESTTPNRDAVAMLLKDLAR